MKTKKSKILALAILTPILFGLSCKKISNPEDDCGKVFDVRETQKGHLVDISALNGIPELMDTLTKYPGIQIFKVNNDEYTIGFKANQVYKGVLLFSDQVVLNKSKRYGNVTAMSKFGIDTIALNLNPTINAEGAFKIADAAIKFTNHCKTTVQLGIMNRNASSPNQTKNYKLTWRVIGLGGNVLLDAHTGELYEVSDGTEN